MSLSELKDRIPEYGRDIKLNLESVLTPEGAAGLTPRQIWGVALASAYAVAGSSVDLVHAVLEEGGSAIDDSLRTAAQGAATIMAMNNVYYRSIHLMDDPELKKRPARLRMNIIGKSGIEKADFELMCFAVSAIAGCGQCLTAHLNELRKAGVGDDGIHASLRIASVINAAQRALLLSEL
ncbi:MAG: alkyl hydroperoxide reductase [Calothrix sp. SM1_5_4]|nr:alkyl hydroperoxide reductase [Calothrix sp. SM1_5_4]